VNGASRKYIVAVSAGGSDSPSASPTATSGASRIGKRGEGGQVAAGLVDEAGRSIGDVPSHVDRDPEVSRGGHDKDEPAVPVPARAGPGQHGIQQGEREGAGDQDQVNRDQAEHDRCAPGTFVRTIPADPAMPLCGPLAAA
jgi:hypothetical protein